MVIFGKYHPEKIFSLTTFPTLELAIQATPHFLINVPKQAGEV